MNQDEKREQKCGLAVFLEQALRLRCCILVSQELLILRPRAKVGEGHIVFDDRPAERRSRCRRLAVATGVAGRRLMGLGVTVACCLQVDQT